MPVNALANFIAAVVAVDPSLENLTISIESIKEIILSAASNSMFVGSVDVLPKLICSMAALFIVFSEYPMVTLLNAIPQSKNFSPLSSKI